MSRDMQIGLLLAVGFLALVGGVLYYRIEHPDDLEQFWNNAEQLAQGPQPPAPAEAGKESGELQAATQPAPPVPTAAPPLETKPEPTASQPGVVLTGGATTGATTPVKSPDAPPINTDIKINLDPGSSPPVATKSEANKQAAPAAGGAPAISPPKPDAAPVLAGNENKPVPPKAEDKASNTTTRQSFPNEAGSSAPAKSDGGPTPPAPRAPEGNTTPPLLGGNSPKPMDDKTLAGAPKIDTKPANASLGSSTTSATGTTSAGPPLPSAPLFAGNSPPSPGTTPSLNDKKEAEKPTNPPAPTAPAVSVGDAARKPTEVRADAKPPATVAVTPGTPTSPLPQELPPPPDLNAGSKPSPGSAAMELKPTPPSVSHPPAAAPPSPLNTSAPATTRSTTEATSPKDSEPTSRVTPDGRYREYLAPKATLGRPVPESVSAEQERRWAETAGAPSPIVPSSADVRGTATRGNAKTAPATIANTERRVVSDSYLPRERAVAGETFSSLSQRLYGDTSYAAALAAFNRDEGIVTNDQPTANEWVAKPNREILDLKYPHLIRPASRPALARNATTPAPRNAATNRGEGAVPATDLPIYRVGKGEQLFEVARKTLGDGYRWSEIYALNKEMLRESTELRADMLLKLPGDAKVDGPKAR